MSNALEIVAKRPVLNHTLTVYGNAENPLFLAKDVAEWIEHSDTSTMLRNIDDEEKVSITNPNNVCGGQSAWFLTESGLYEVLMLSRKPIAKQFKKEVKKILHELRTKGTITITPDLPMLPEKSIVSTAQLAAELGISASQIHGIVYRNKNVFADNVDIIRRRQNYFTPSGVEKIKKISEITSFQYRTGFAEDDVIMQIFVKNGFSSAMYLTYLMLINWYELNERQMFNIVQELNSICGTRVQEVSNQAEAVISAAAAVGNVETAVKAINSTLNDFIMELLANRNCGGSGRFRLTQKAFEEVTGGKTKNILFRKTSMVK